MTIDPVTLENRRFKLSLSGEVGSCTACDEEGRVPCGDCAGTGEDRTCNECGEIKYCRTCAGFAKMRCPHCEGTRLALVSERPAPPSDDGTLALPFPTARLCR